MIEFREQIDGLWVPAKFEGGTVMPPRRETLPILAHLVRAEPHTRGSDGWYVAAAGARIWRYYDQITIDPEDPDMVGFGWHGIFAPRFGWDFGTSITRRLIGDYHEIHLSLNVWQIP